MHARLGLVVLALSVGWLIACDQGDDTYDSEDMTPEDVTPLEACEMIIEACHLKDDGQSAEVSECHSVAHDGEAGTSEHREICLDRLEECVEICESAPDPEGGDESSGGDAEEGDDRY